jgi:hypothetical protein
VKNFPSSIADHGDSRCQHLSFEAAASPDILDSSFFNFQNYSTSWWKNFAIKTKRFCDVLFVSQRVVGVVVLK